VKFTVYDGVPQLQVRSPGGSITWLRPEGVDSAKLP